jgi:hypothetical protein
LPAFAHPHAFSSCGKTTSFLLGPLRSKTVEVKKAWGSKPNDAANRRDQG